MDEGNGDGSDFLKKVCASIIFSKILRYYCESYDNLNSGFKMFSGSSQGQCHSLLARFTYEII